MLEEFMKRKVNEKMQAESSLEYGSSKNILLDTNKGRQDRFERADLTSPIPSGQDWIHIVAPRP
jgi:hypothetical protein